MIDLVHDEKCQTMIKDYQFRLRMKKYSTLIIAILLTIVCVYTFSEITVQFGDFYFSHNLGLGWFGFILSYLLLALIWLSYVVLKYIFQILESQKLSTYMDNECDPLRAIYVMDNLVKKKLIKEDNAFDVLVRILKALNQKERIIYLLRKYPKAGNKTNSRMKTWFGNKKKTIKKQKQRELFDNIEKSYDIDYLFYLKDYSAYLEYVEKLREITPLYNVSCHLVMAKCYLALNNKEKAEECLCFVLEHGNTSYYVEEANILYSKEFEDNKKR